MSNFDAIAWKRALETGDMRFATSHFRTATTRGRSLEAGVNLTQLRPIGGRQLRILAEGAGATAEDVGKFWFVPGYSLVGGPDIVPQS